MGELGSELDLIRLPSQSPAGRALAGPWRLLGTPTFILFDGRGQELLRSPLPPDAAALRARLAAP